MKKILLMLVTLILCVSMCSCGKPDVDSCVTNADTVVESHEPYLEECYKFSSKYLEDENSYVIVMSIDEDKVEEALKDSDSRYTDMLRDLAIQKLDEDTETISFELEELRKSVEPLFEDTDVTVLTGYVDAEGNAQRVD